MKKHLIAGALMLAIVGLLFNGALHVNAQTDRPSLTPIGTNTPTYLIRNARIVTVSGAEIENGTLVIQNGKIAAVGAGNVTAPAGAQVIDGSGLQVYPGMIDLGTAMGLVEIPQGAPGTVDTAEIGDLNPQAQAFVALNPHSAHIRVTRVNGITNALSLPQGGIISGQAAFINLDGTSPGEMALLPDAALVVNFPRLNTGGGFGNQQFAIDINAAMLARDRQVESLRKALRDAMAYGQAQDAAAHDKNLPRPDMNVMLAALEPYARGARPIIVRANSAADIRAAVKFAEEMKLKIILLGGNDAWKEAQLLRAKNVPVVLTGVLDLPRTDDDNYDVQYENAAKLQAAGVRFAISVGDDGANTRDLPFHAGMSVAFGLPRAEALKAVTLYPAQIMGMDARLGSLEVGKLANLVVTDGDLLDARTKTRYLFINGKMLPLTSHHTELYEQFKSR